MLQARGISRAHGGHVVLDEVTVQLDGRDRVGVVGPNGVGKSTLLRIMAGIDLADRGTIERRPLTLTVGYLPQEPDPGPGETLHQYLARRTGVADAGAELDRLTAALAGDPDVIDAYSEALDHFLALGGADFDARAAEIVHDVGLGGPRAHSGATDGTGAARLEQSLATLSGGEAARALLAAILLSRFDVLLLDEPTNNLDFVGLDQLENFAAGFPGALLVVSHDRAFLDRVVHRVVEIDEHSHRLHEYAGGWTEYVDARALARSQQYAAHDRYVSERDRLQERQRTQLAWSQKGIKRAKTSGENDKNIRRGMIASSEKLAGKRKITEKRIAQLDVVDKPWEGWQLRLSLRPNARSGEVVARLDGAVVERGGPDPFRLGPIDLEIAWQERLGILGRNGSGKTTLLGGLLGHFPVVSGRRWLGPGVVVGELDQNRRRYAGGGPRDDRADDARTRDSSDNDNENDNGEDDGVGAGVLARFQAATGLALSESRSLLAKFGLGADHVTRPVGSLSPGERTRVLLAEVTARGVNCLVLDEPTNHLDLEAIEQLELALTAFDGTLVVVSHDRRFLEGIDLTRTIAL